MPRGPTPKNPAIRQRRNKEVTAASFIDTSPIADGNLPELPPRDDGEEWAESVHRWWHTVWTSPMAKEYTEADVDGLVLLMDLTHRYWQKPTTSIAGEIRLQRQCYGLTPIDRRRLQWEIKRVEPEKQEKPVQREPSADPRAALRAVK